MKLISMTEFVLDQDTNQPSARRLSQIIGYAEFLKQPLKLEMFVPCDDNGNVLNQQLCDFAKYEQAKEKVLFKGLEHKKIPLNYRIEDLVKYRPTLTQNATKQFL